MSEGTVTIPIEVWEMSMRDAELIAQMHKEAVRLHEENIAIKTENRRLRKAAKSVDVAFQDLDNGLTATPHWVKQQAMRDAVSQLRAAAKEGGGAK